MGKRMISFLSAVILLFSLAACGNADTGTHTLQPEQTENQTVKSIEAKESEAGGSETTTENKTGRVLVAYFSWAENAVQDNIDAMTSASVKLPGNVAQLAAWIAEETEGELFSIQVTEPYPADWDDCLNRANKEKSENARPKLTQTVEDIEDYDVIFLGYPN